MKLVFSVSLLLLGLNCFASSPNFTCTMGACHDVEKPVNATSWCDDGLAEAGAGPLTVVLSDLTPSRDGKTIFQIINDGDQFKQISLNAASSDQASAMNRVAGTYSDGFDWVDGDHLRYSIDLSCVKN